MKTICINCPLGCSIEVNEMGGRIVVTGNTCARGRDYGVTEFLRPVRTITTLVKREDGAVVSVKTSSPIPKDRISDFQRHIRGLVAPAGVRPGDILERDALGLVSDIVVTGVPDASK